MNKKVKMILNVLIAIASLAFLVIFIVMVSSIKYATRETEDPVETERSVFEYELSHRSYGEVMEDYYSDRLTYFEPQPGTKDIYNVAEYAHAAFMSKVYDAKGDDSMIRANDAKMQDAKDKLGAYAYIADEVDKCVKRDGSF